MQFLRLVTERFCSSLLTLLLVSLIIFWMLEILPGDVASRILGRDATPEALDRAALSACIWTIRRCVRYVAWLAASAHRQSRPVAGSRPAGRRSSSGRASSTPCCSRLYAFLLYLPLTIIPALIQARATATGRSTTPSRS